MIGDSSNFWTFPKIEIEIPLPYKLKSPLKNAFKYEVQPTTKNRIGLVFPRILIKSFQILTDAQTGFYYHDLLISIHLLYRNSQLTTFPSHSLSGLMG